MAAAAAVALVHALLLSYSSPPATGMVEEDSTTPSADASQAMLERYPVVLVPGFAGSALEMWASSSYVPPHRFCDPLRGAWSNAWIDIDRFANRSLPFFPCWEDEIALHFNGKRFEGAQGIEVRPVGWGRLEGVADLDATPGHMGDTNYYEPMIRHLEAVGYQRNLDLVGAPYDWRLPPSALEVGGYFERLRLLVEATSKQNERRPVVLISVGTGGLVMQHMARVPGMDSKWFDQNVQCMVAIDTPFLGTPQFLQTLVSGGDFGFGPVIMSYKEGRRLARRWPAVPWLMPTIDGWGDTSIVSVLRESGVHKYSSADLDKVLVAAGALHSARVYGDERRRAPAVPPPAKYYCFYGTGSETPVQFMWQEHELDEEPTVESEGNGDGLTPYRSLSWCRYQWPSMEYSSDRSAIVDEKQVEWKEFPGLSHSSMQHSPKVIQDVINIATTFVWSGKS